MWVLFSDTESCTGAGSLTRIVRVLQASRLRGIPLITLAGLACHMLLQRASRSVSAARWELPAALRFILLFWCELDTRGRVKELLCVVAS